MDNFSLVEWLYENGGPVIKWRTANELMDNLGGNKEKLFGDVLKDERVAPWVETFVESTNNLKNYNWLRTFHGSFSYTFENYCGKLYSLGIIKGDTKIDDAASKYIELVKQSSNDGFATAMAALLTCMGYTDDNTILDLLKADIERIHNFVKKKNYNIYIDAKDCPPLPSALKGVKRVINPEFITSYTMPTLYSVFEFIPVLELEELKEYLPQINDIIGYVYDYRYYENIREGYGCGVWPNGNYYSLGWSVHIPGFIKNKNINLEALRDLSSSAEQYERSIRHNFMDYNYKTLFWAEILSKFEPSKSCIFFKEFLDYLEQYRTEKGTYILPKKMLPENKNGYWIVGMRQGLAENRRKKDALEIESTFRVLKLKKNLGIYQ